MKLNKIVNMRTRTKEKEENKKKENTIVIVYDEFTFLHMLSANNCANYSEFKSL